MGHLYPGMLDVSTDLTLIPANLGGHVEVLEFDDLRVRVEKVTDAEVKERMDARARRLRARPTRSTTTTSPGRARVSVGLDRLVDDFALDSLAYYHRGLDGEIHERLGAGMILGASLLTARGIPAAGEYELRTSLAMLIMDRLGAGGSFTEFQALNFRGRRRRDGPRRARPPGDQRAAAAAARASASTTASAAGACRSSSTSRTARSPLLGLRQKRDGSFAFVVSEGDGGHGPLLRDRQHHLPRRLRPRPRRVDRRLERDRHLPPLGPRAPATAPPNCAPWPTCSASR